MAKGLGGMPRGWAVPVGLPHLAPWASPSIGLPGGRGWSLRLTTLFPGPGTRWAPGQVYELARSSLWEAL